MVPLSNAISFIFSQLQKKEKHSSSIRAVDFRHFLLVLPFILGNLFEKDVAEYNVRHPAAQIRDPSGELVSVANTLIKWYHLYRRSYPPKDMSDIDEALRTYWSFKVYGEDRVAVLDGGIAGWLSEGREYTTTNAQKVAGNWSAKAFRQELIASSDEVAAASKGGKQQLLDARQPAQYLGLAKRPDVQTFGHIAGSKELAPELLAKPMNGALYFWQKNTYDALMSANGLNVKGPTIAYCNTGHLAAGGWFVMSELVGNKSTKLYDGSLYLWTLEGRPLVGVPLN